MFGSSRADIGVSVGGLSVYVTDQKIQPALRAATPAPVAPAPAHQEESRSQVRHPENPLRDAFLKTSWASLLVPFFLGIGVLLAIVLIAVFAR